MQRFRCVQLASTHGRDNNTMVGLRKAKSGALCETLGPRGPKLVIADQVRVAPDADGKGRLEHGRKRSRAQRRMAQTRGGGDEPAAGKGKGKKPRVPAPASPGPSGFASRGRSPSPHPQVVSFASKLAEDAFYDSKDK